MPAEHLKEAVRLEIDKLRTIHQLRMPSIVDNAIATDDQLANNAVLRSYKHSLANVEHGLTWLEDNHDGPAYDKELERWRQALLSDAGRVRDIGEKQAYIDFSNSVKHVYTRSK